MNEQEMQWHEKAIVNRLNDPTASISDIANLAEQNPLLTEQIIAKANSALYGSRRPVTTLKQAILLIGFRNVKTIVQDLQKKKKKPDQKTMEKNLDV